MGFSQFTLGFNGPGWAVDGGVPWLSWRDEMNATRMTAGMTVQERRIRRRIVPSRIRWSAASSGASSPALR
jgi:hypothetical protein